MKIEECVKCNEPTGKAGPGDDSIFLTHISDKRLEIGPLCEDCARLLIESGDWEE